MFDFYYGDKEKIIKHPKDYIIFIKRMLPRWLNCIPDSECLAIWDTLQECSVDNNKGTIIETGTGASTICLALYSVINKRRFMSWDINPCRGSELCKIINETIGKSLNVNIWNTWTFIAGSSLDPHLGLKVIKEKELNVDYAFFDSLHTEEHLVKELNEVLPNLVQGSVVAIDDANYSNKEYNYNYINLQRKKIGLLPVEEHETNVTNKYYATVENILRTKYTKILKLKDTYKNTYKDDIYFEYYNEDKRVMNNYGMEKLDDLSHRFDCWKIEKL